MFIIETYYKPFAFFDKIWLVNQLSFLTLADTRFYANDSGSNGFTAIRKCT